MARYGGDEFVVLCAGLSEADAAALVERLHAAVADPLSSTAARTCASGSPSAWPWRTSGWPGTIYCGVRTGRLT